MRNVLSAVLDWEQRQIAACFPLRSAAESSITADEAQEEHEDDCSAGGNENGGDHSVVDAQTEVTGNEAAHKRTGNADDYVHEKPVATALHDFAR
jgi:hypothetical protein